jgi:hypothetical protein
MPDEVSGLIVHEVSHEIDACARSGAVLPATYNKRRARESWSLLPRGKGEHE